MRFTPLALPDVVVVQQTQIGDSRGFFARVFCREEMRAHGISDSVEQCNNTLTQRCGSIRGMHFQRPPKAEAKLVRCVRGGILDVAVDLRKNSETFGQHVTCELTSENRAMLAIPPGFAHGFQTLTDDVELIYFHSESYSPSHEGGVNPLASDLGIRWPLEVAELSERDRSLPSLESLEPIEL